VARELASHLRLKLVDLDSPDRPANGGEGTGFSSEIETIRFIFAEPVLILWRGNWLLI